MYEYKSEVVRTTTKLTGRKLKDSEVCPLDNLDALINEKASEGWELAFHSMAFDATLGNYNILLTFKRHKG